MRAAMHSEILYVSNAGPVTLGREGGDRPRAPLVVVADLAEETFARVALPPVRGPDRWRLVRRQLQQQFPQTPYKMALPLARAAASEATDVLVGVPAAALDAALQPYVQAGRPVRGVWTVALLVAWWVRLTGKTPPHCLVIVATPAGMRHVFLAHGKPLLTRLVPHDVSGSDAVPAEQEIVRTAQYLYNARLLEHGAPVRAWALGIPAPAAVAGTRLRLQWEKPPVAPRLPDVAARGFAGLCELAVVRPPRSQLAPAAVRIHYLAGWLRRAAAMATTAICLAAVAAITVHGSEAAGSAAAASALRAEAAALAARTRAAQTIDPQLGVAAAEAVRRLAAYERAIGHAVAPAAALASIARAFDAAPLYTLEELHWRSDAAVTDAAAAGTDCDPIGESVRASVALRGSIVADAPLRAVVQARSRFEQTLAAAAGARVDVQHAPIDAGGEQPIHGGAQQRQARAFAYCVRFEATR